MLPRHSCRGAMQLGVGALAVFLLTLQGIAAQDGIVTSPSGRRLASYFAHDFGASIDTVCYRSAYLSPYRMYSIKISPADSHVQQSVLEFEIRTVTCRVTTSPCCNEPLSQLTIRAGPLASSVVKVEVGGGVKPLTDVAVDVYGLNIYNLDVPPNANQVISLAITVNGRVNFFKDFCPDGRFEGSCDFIALNPTKTCCLNRAAVPISLFVPPPPVGPGFTAPPPPPPPPPPTYACCVDDVYKSPYRIKFLGKQQTGSDTAFDYQLWVVPVNTNQIDLDAPEPGTCGKMSIRDIRISVFNKLFVKQVILNDTAYDWMEHSNTASSTWVSVSWPRQFDELDPLYPIDFTVVVRGKVDELCPATQFMKAPNVCEYVIHGRDQAQQCCPHSLTKHTETEPCCVDDLPRSPYRLQYLRHTPTSATTTFTFGIAVVDAAEGDYDQTERGNCDKMSLDSAQISLFSNLNVTEVAWNGRLLPFAVTPATSYSSWLNISGLHTYWAEADKITSSELTISVEGYVNEPCPATWQFGGSSYNCEYVFHGVQSAYSCCPHGISTRGTVKDTCGCRDDLTETPFRMAYAAELRTPDITTFRFNLARVDPLASQDFDGQDFNLNHEVNCSGMGIQDIKLDIYSWYTVQAVRVNGYPLDFQTTPNTPYSSWLWILGVDLPQSELTMFQPITVEVTVAGGPSAVTELCPASAHYGSASSCEYIVTSQLPAADVCCPKGVTTYYSPDSIKVAGSFAASY